MVAASTSYEAHAGPVPAVTPVRYRPCGTTHTVAHGASPRTVKEADRLLSYGDMAAATIRERPRTEVPQ